ncbi:MULTISPECIES: hypothetical protein [unclassified Streptomyces]|uniref:hypothetical protein n=1 Tax=unclassified Streptomyces TaxID=2593676 RepID=UPI002257CB15|nr:MULTISPECIES: hypothetical protein [unclassified Streptomyces]MCX5049023.1 hypothetical protein [Streptomyces sp. NBC_00474]MCX5056231.1 hypothetical protein [Streptomyces sp. NBC_00452]MCX5287335.1 hypothetical protein [Streptomyces sp. NBC_00183]
MNRPIPGTVQVAVRHILSDKTTGVFTRTRRITWRDSHYRVRRPKSGKQTVELTCPVCDASLLAEVRDEARTRRTATILLVLAALSLIVFFLAFGYAIHEGGKTLPEGQSLPTLFPVSVVSVFVTFVAAPVLFLQGRRYNGVSMLDAPKPRRLHGVMPVRG